MALISYAYTDGMTFGPLQTQTHETGSTMGVDVQQRRSCSPRSMYSLATAVSIRHICVVPGSNMLEAWDRQHQGGCTNGHPIQALHFQHRAGTLFFLFSKVGVCYYRFFQSHSDLIQSHCGHGHGDTVPPQKLDRERPQVTDGPHQENGI